MPGDTIHPESRHRLLCDPGLHSKHPRRHFVVGVFLDQRGGFAGTCLARSAHCANDDHHERRSTLVPASSFLRQSCRYLDDPLHVFRLRVVDRVRGR